MTSSDQQLTQLLKALTSQTAIDLFKLMMVKGESIMPTLAANELGMSVQTVSYNLREMNKVGLLNRVQHGRYALYTINPQALTILRNFINGQTS